MSRIRKGYERRFRERLRALHARKLEQAVAWLVAKAQSLSSSEGISLPEAMARVQTRLVSTTALANSRRSATPDRFFCDAGLGGLARWLRAAGYDTLWQPDISDDELLRVARAESAAILTTDSLLTERRVIRDGVIVAFWLPPTFGIAEQLAQVFREFGLKVREPRCMSCGGALRSGDKEALRERIPPRTYRWLDQYFECERCGKLFWRGTHWQRISEKLKAFGG